MHGEKTCLGSRARVMVMFGNIVLDLKHMKLLENTNTWYSNNKYMIISCVGKHGITNDGILNRRRLICWLRGHMFSKKRYLGIKPNVRLGALSAYF